MPNQVNKWLFAAGCMGWALFGLGSLTLAAITGSAPAWMPIAALLFAMMMIGSLVWLAVGEGVRP